MNGSCNLDETYREYSIAHTDDLIRFWRSKVKVRAGRRGGEGIHFDASSFFSYVFVLMLSFSRPLQRYGLYSCRVCLCDVGV